MTDEIKQVQQPGKNNNESLDDTYTFDVGDGISKEDLEVAKLNLAEDTFVKEVMGNAKKKLEDFNTKDEVKESFLPLLNFLTEQKKITEEQYNELIELIPSQKAKTNEKQATPEELKTLKDGLLVDVDRFKAGVSDEFDKIIGSMDGLEALLRGTAKNKKESLLLQIDQFHDTIDKATTAKEVLQTLKNNIDRMKLAIAKEQDKRATNLVAFVGTAIGGFETTLSAKEKQYELKLDNTQIVENTNKEKRGVESTVRSFADSITGYLAAGKEVLNSMSDIIISVFDTLLTVCDMLGINIRKYFPDAALAILDTLLKDKFGLSPKQNEYVKNIYEKYDIAKEADLKLVYNSISTDNKVAKVEIGYNKQEIKYNLTGQLETLTKDQDVIDVDYNYIKSFESVYSDVSKLTVKDVEVQGTYGKKIVKKIENTDDNKDYVKGFINIFVDSENAQGKVGELVQYSHKKNEDGTDPKSPIIDAKGVCMAYGSVLLKGDLARHTIGVNDLPNKKQEIPVNNNETTDTSDPVAKYDLTKEKISDGKYKIYYDAAKTIALGSEWTKADLTDEKIQAEIKKYEDEIIKNELAKEGNREKGTNNFEYLKKIFVSDGAPLKLVTRYSYLAEHLKDYESNKAQIKVFFEYLKNEQDGGKNLYKAGELSNITNAIDTYVLFNNGGVITLKEKENTDNDDPKNIIIEQGLGKYKNEAEVSEVLTAGDFAYPLAGEKRIINRGYGHKYHPIHKKFMLHSGIDLPAKEGDDLYAIGKGKIVGKGFEDKRSKGGDGGGNYIVLEFENGKRVSYCHLKEESSLNIGDNVEKLDKIGFAGATGDATGPHLHLTFKNKDLSTFDPLIEGSEFKELFEQSTIEQQGVAV